MISACEKGAQPVQVSQLLRKLHQQSDEPNVISYSSAMSACEKGAQPEQAVQLLRAAISACEKGVEPEQALQLLCEMLWQSVESDVISYNVAISACEEEFESSRWCCRS